MKDVAQEAGVALGTVSKVFNGIAVGESYRIKVEDAARKLGYEVNQYARGLRAGTTFTVALILPSVDHPFFSLLAQHVCAALLQRSYRMLLYVTAAQPEAERECLGMVRQNKVDGVIALTYNHLEVAEGLPFVSIDRCLGPNIPCVAADNYAGGRLAAEKLLELGCTHPAFLRVGSLNLSETDKRGDGFESLCRARQVPYEMLRLDDGAEDIQFREFFQAHMKDGRLEIDGIFCATDLLACRIRAMLEELGLRVPEDVQIIGFNGIRQFGTGALYCSTIIQPVQKIAETSVELLLTKDRSNVPALVCLPVSYAPGGTTKE
ncbi:MAG: LacI family DNA-binding transcriptional regulator [Dysosmobacter sp.]|nr:LacI family DNA-binding transcriptional regulator [Dysosmobacter sp.]